MKLVLDPEEQEIVQKIQALRDEGCSLRSIAGQLNEAGIPAKNGGVWYASTVSYILTNDLYKSITY